MYNAGENKLDKQIKGWMLANYEDHIGPLTGLLCMTTLAEDAANSLFDRAADDIEFELAYEFGKKHNLLGD